VYQLECAGRLSYYIQQHTDVECIGSSLGVEKSWRLFGENVEKRSRVEEIWRLCLGPWRNISLDGENMEIIKKQHLIKGSRHECLSDSLYEPCGQEF
jgi:hypothetical protein